METQSKKSNSLLKSSLLIFVLFLGLSQKGMTQNEETKQNEAIEFNTQKKQAKAKNTLRVTPLKAFISQRTNFAYEREIYKNLYVTAELQAWFLDRSPGNFLFSNPNDRSVNKGKRYALGARYYHTKGLSKTSFYIGANLFYGNHKIREKQAADIGFFSETRSGRNGEIDLVSQGAKLSLGLRRTFVNTLFIEIGLDLGKSWTNKEKDTLTLYPNDKSEDVYEKEFHRIVSGQFVEPMLAVGFVF